MCREGWQVHHSPVFYAACKRQLLRGIGIAPKIAVKFLFDTVSLHSEQHQECVMESHLTVSCEVFTGIDGILAGVSGKLIDCRQKYCFDDIRVFHNVPP